ncbi:MAG TPA: carboxypeptidase-like regulatory domain-containing protein [Candidatus Dormibacteraeota bacterium]
MATFAVLLVAGCGAKTGPSGTGGNAALGTVRGHVLLYPCAPVERVGSPCPGRPASGIEVDLVPEAGGQALSAKSATDGSYAIQAPPGTYQATVKTVRPVRGVRMVAVTAGQTATVDFVIDSGIR